MDNIGDTNKIELSLSISEKWKRYRDSHYKLYELTDDIESYKKSMAMFQAIIKNWMTAYDEQIVEAVTNICNQEEDDRFKLKFICAGYELASGLDYSTPSISDNMV